MMVTVTAVTIVSTKNGSKCPLAPTERKIHSTESFTDFKTVPLALENRQNPALRSF